METINLKDEMNTLINTSGEQDKLLLRHMTSTKCPCLLQPPMIYNKETLAQIPNPAFRTGADPNCPNCEGHGWIFVESIIQGKMFYPAHRVAHEQEYYYGTTQANIIHLYLPATPANIIIDADDILFQLDADVNGNLIDPIVRTKKWYINDVYYLRLDNNKLEFLKVFAKAMVI